MVCLPPGRSERLDGDQYMAVRDTAGFDRTGRTGNLGAFIFVRQ
jgi:hypothetical protein